MAKGRRPCASIVRDFVLAFEASTPTQNTLLVAMSLFAQPDGTGVYPGTANLYTLTGLKKGKRGKLKETIGYWLKVGVLREVSPGRPKHAAEYCINVDKMAHFISKDSVPTVEPSPRANPIPNSVPASAPSSSSELGTRSQSTRCPSPADSVPNRQNTVPTSVLQSIKDQKKVIEDQKKEFKTEVPSFVPKNSWTDYLEMRELIGRPMTKAAREIIWEKLHKLADEGEDPGAVLEQSIRNSWQDVFPIRKERSYGKGKLDPDEITRRNLATIHEVLGRTRGGD